MTRTANLTDNRHMNRKKDNVYSGLGSLQVNWLLEQPKIGVHIPLSQGEREVGQSQVKFTLSNYSAFFLAENLPERECMAALLFRRSCLIWQRKFSYDCFSPCSFYLFNCFCLKIILMPLKYILNPCIFND